MEQLLIEDVKRILLIRFGSLGDVVLTLPVVSAVRKHFPDSYIAMVVGDRSADIVSADPRLNDVIVLHRRKKGLSEMRRVVDLIREGNFDVSIDMQRKFRSSILPYWAGVVYRIGYHQPGGLFCTVKIPDTYNKHAIDRNLDLLKPLGIVEADREPEMHLSADDRDYAVRAFSDYGLKPDSVTLGMFPGAGWYKRCWAPERFATIGDLAVSAFSAQIVIFAGPGEADIADSVTRNMKSPAVIMKDRVTLRQLSAMIERCDLFLSNDTGPMHISVSVKTPTVALFGPGNHIKFQPIGDRHALVRNDVPCSPCKQFTEKCKDNICMKSITVEQVWEAVSGCAKRAGIASAKV